MAGDFRLFFPRRFRLASASIDGTIRIWNVDLARSDFEIRPDLAAKMVYHRKCLAFSPDGRVLAIPGISGTTATLTLWDPASGLRLASLTEPRSLVVSLSFSPDRRILAAGTVAGVIELWDVATGQRQADLMAHFATAWAFAFSPDGKSLVSGSVDGALRLWDMRPE